jgi:hypothetical protein
MRIIFVLFWAVTGISVLDPLPASAQPAHSFEELARQLRVGQIVIVTDTQGGTRRGRVQGFSPDDSLRIVVGEREERISQSNVQRIETEHRPIAKGAIAGGSLGVASGWMLWHLYHDCGACGPSPAGSMISFGAIGTGIGVGIGAVIVHRLPVFESSQDGAGRVTFVPMWSADRGLLIVVHF